MTLDFVREWDGGCLWGSKRMYPDVEAFLEAVRKEMSWEQFGVSIDGLEEDEELEVSANKVTETRLRFCIGKGCSEDGEPHWHPAPDNPHAAPVWQYLQYGDLP